MFNTHIQQLEGYSTIPAGCVDIVRTDGRSTVYLSQLPDGKVVLTDDQDHIEMQVMPGIAGAEHRVDTIRAIAQSRGLSLSSSGALVAICQPGEVDNTLSRFADANRQIAHLELPLAA